MLAAAVKARGGESVLDVGAGVGVAGLCLLARVPGLEVTAVEIDAKLCALAAKNAELNGFATSFTIVNADVTAAANSLRETGLVREGYRRSSPTRRSTRKEALGPRPTKRAPRRT